MTSDRTAKKRETPKLKGQRLDALHRLALSKNKHEMKPKLVTPVKPVDRRCIIIYRLVTFSMDPIPYLNRYIWVRV